MSSQLGKRHEKSRYRWHWHFPRHRPPSHETHGSDSCLCVCVLARARLDAREDLWSLSLSHATLTNTNTKRVRANNGAPVSPILMLCEGELSPLGSRLMPRPPFPSRRHLATAGPFFASHPRFFFSSSFSTGDPLLPSRLFPPYHGFGTRCTIVEGYWGLKLSACGSLHPFHLHRHDKAASARGRSLYRFPSTSPFSEYRSLRILLQQTRFNHTHASFSA